MVDSLTIVLPISLPNSFGITQLPFSGLAPPGILAAPQALHSILRPQILQDTPDHIHADIRARLLQFGDAERA